MVIGLFWVDKNPSGEKYMGHFEATNKVIF